MEKKIYFFSKLNKRENSKVTLESKKNHAGGLLFPKMRKIYAPNLSIISSPSHFKPYSLSPLHQLKINPRSTSYKQVNKKAKLSNRSTSKPPYKANIRYLVQDYEDIEILNAVRTPEDSLKNSKNTLTPDLQIPDFEELFSHIKKPKIENDSRPDSPFIKNKIVINM